MLPIKTRAAIKSLVMNPEQFGMVHVHAINTQFGLDNTIDASISTCVAMQQYLKSVADDDIPHTIVKKVIQTVWACSMLRIQLQNAEHVYHECREYITQHA